MNFDSFIAIKGMFGSGNNHLRISISNLKQRTAFNLKCFPVSYTHLDVYKRQDMAYFGFTNKLVKGETIKIFNYGNCKRDFTYVDDIVEGCLLYTSRCV